MTYSEKLKDPRWQKKRLKILERDNWTCVLCEAKDKTLVVHHTFYRGEPWEVDNKCLHTLCEDCHKLEHENRAGAEEDIILILKQNGFMSDDIYTLSAHILIDKIKRATANKGNQNG